MSYTITEHRHRFAAWAASRAASVKGCRFSVEDGARILESAGFDISLKSPGQLPSPDRIDEVHRQWRSRVIADANDRGHFFSHGVAAKLINCYLKSRFVCGGEEGHPHVSALHPPVDRLLLTALSSSADPSIRRHWRDLGKPSWSNFDSATYEIVIELIRATVGTAPMWMIEEYWRGHQ